MRTTRDITIDFARGLCLPLMLLDDLRNLRVGEYLFQPVGFFSAAAVFVFLSGFATSRTLRERSWMWRRALQLYGLYLSASAAAIALAAKTPLGREIEIAVSDPWRALAEAALLQPGVPMLDFLAMYVVLLIATPFLMERFEAGKEKLVLGLSFLGWLGSQFHTGWGSWQFLFVTALYLGFVQRTQPLSRPEGVRGLNLGLFGAIVALGILRHSGIVTETGLGPLAVVNLYLWVVFLWLVPRPLLRMARQGRLFALLGKNAMAVCAWQVLVFYSFMSWFPEVNRLPLPEQALVACFAVLCLIYPLALGITWLGESDPARNRPCA